MTIYTLYVALLFVTVIIGIALAAYAWQHRRTPGATAFTSLMLGVALWSFALAMMTLSDSPEAADFWGRRVRFIAVATVPVLLLVFAIQYTGREKWLSWSRLALLFTIPLITMVLTWSGKAQHLFLDYSTVKIGPYTFFESITNAGPWTMVHLTYGYLAIFLSLMLFLIQVFRTRFPYRGQAIMLSIGSLCPVLANVPTSFLQEGPRLSYTPFGFLAMGLIYAWALFGYRLFDIVPVARDLVIENIGDAVLVLDERYRLVDVNPAAQSLVGRTASELIGKPLEQVLPAWSDMAERHDPDFHAEIVMGSGEGERQIALSHQPIRDRSELLVGHLLLLRDITARKQAEDALQRAYNELEGRVVERTAELTQEKQIADDIINSLPGAFHVYDDQARLIRWNDKHLELSGYSAEESLHKHALELIVEEDRAMVARSIEQVLDEGSAQVEAQVLTKTGERIPMLLTTVRTTLGVQPVFMGLSIDITERKKMEAELQSYRDHLENLVAERTAELRKLSQAVEQSASTVVITDREGSIEYANPSFEDTTGYTVDEALGQNPNILKAGVHDEAHYRELWETITSGQTWRGEFYNKRKDGSFYWERATIAPVVDESGQITNFIAVKDDITQRKQAKQALERRVEELAVLNLIAHTVATVTDLPQALEGVAQTVTYVFNASASAIGVWGDGQMEILARFDRDREPSGLTSHFIPMATAPAIREPLDRGEAISIPDIQAVPLPAGLDADLRTRNIRAMLLAPLRARGTAFGIVAVARDQTGDVFSPAEVNLAETIAADIAGAIENARLFEQAQELAVIEERNRLARDLHDSVTQTLYSVALMTEALPRVWEQHPDKAQEALSNLHRLARGALGEMRNLLLELQPAMLLEKDLGELLRQLANATMGRTQISVETRMSGERPLPDEVQIALYRIAQEALNNIVKHAATSQAIIELDLEPAQVVLCIHDDGHGFDPQAESGNGYGIRNMTDRAETIGAEFRLESQPGQGTQIKVVWQEPKIGLADGL